MKNSLINEVFIQYKCRDYFKEIVKFPFGEGGYASQCYMKTSDSINYEEVPIELEPTLQYLNSIDIETINGAELGEKLTHKYGFLNFKPFVVLRREAYENNENLKSATGFDFPSIGDKKPIYDGEPISTWMTFVKTIQFFSKSLQDIEYYNQLKPHQIFFRTNEVNDLLKDINLKFDINTQKVSLSSNSFAASMVLYLISKKRHLKSCNECSNLFFAQRTDKLFCHPNCSKKYSRRNNID